MYQTRLRFSSTTPTSTITPQPPSTVKAGLRDVIDLDGEDSCEVENAVLPSPEQAVDGSSQPADTAEGVNIFSVYAFKGDAHFASSTTAVTLPQHAAKARATRPPPALSLPAAKKARRKAPVKASTAVAAVDSDTPEPHLESSATELVVLSASRTTSTASTASTSSAKSSSSASRVHHSLAPLLPQPSLGQLPPLLLILGSAPSEASLKAQSYYAFRFNHFWPIVSSLFHFDPTLPYPERVLALTSHRVAVWDVCRTFTRQGSLDSNLRAVQPNDILDLLRAHPTIRMVASNGGTSAKLFLKHCGVVELKGRGLRFVQLPSSSPAHAMKNAVEEKSKRWKALLEVDDEGGFIDD